jgi:hypothetical protein
MHRRCCTRRPRRRDSPRTRRSGSTCLRGRRCPPLPDRSQRTPARRCCTRSSRPRTRHPYRTPRPRRTQRRSPRCCTPCPSRTAYREQQRPCPCTRASRSHRRSNRPDRTRRSCTVGPRSRSSRSCRGHRRCCPRRRKSPRQSPVPSCTRAYPHGTRGCQRTLPSSNRSRDCSCRLVSVLAVRRPRRRRERWSSRSPNTRGRRPWIRHRRRSRHRRRAHRPDHRPPIHRQRRASRTLPEARQRGKIGGGCRFSSSPGPGSGHCEGEMKKAA